MGADRFEIPDPFPVGVWRILWTEHAVTVFKDGFTVFTVDDSLAAIPWRTPSPILFADRDGTTGFSELRYIEVTFDPATNKFD
jgi:hypothetical protein